FVRVAFPDGTSRDYRGAVQAAKVSSTALQTIDVLSLEDYLLGVVPRESSSSWKPAALQAQAIAARSYTAYKRAHVTSSARYDICDTTQCQVFGGSRAYARDGNGEWGGRVKTVVLEGVSSSGSATSVTTTGAGVYNARSWPSHSDGLRSSWWHITATTDASVVTQSAAPRLVRSPGASTGRL